MKNRYKTIGLISLLGIFFIYVLISFCTGGKEKLVKNDKEEIFVDEGLEVEELKEKDIVVEIKGEVKEPNIYYLEEGSIIGDLIIEAGGLTEEANIDGINRAELLSSHQCIVIPNKNEVDEEVAVISQGVLETNNKEGLININKATESELDTLPGIGPSRAADIISYRESNGGFKSIDEIKNVKGIGEASFEKLKEKITI